MTIRIKIRAAIRKNYPELKALMSGKFPDFVYGKGLRDDMVPVFVFHEIEPVTFEQKLIYLKENDYETLNADELLNHLKSSRANDQKYVVLTFDDGHVSLWQHAYPLLKKYDFKAVSFICPGLVPDGEKDESVNKKRKLCNWKEIKEMHDSGHLDFQSHGMYHDLVFVSTRLIDFYSPHFSSSYLGKREIPVVLHDDKGFSITNLWPYDVERNIDYFGVPIFEHAPRFAVENRLQFSQEVANHMCDFVKINGGVSFLKKSCWKKYLQREFYTFKNKEEYQLVVGKEYQNDIIQELNKAKGIIEEKLTGKEVRHICYPWFETVKACLTTASFSGYFSAFLGVDTNVSIINNSDCDFRVIRRLPDNYIELLPGKHRKNLLSAFIK